jgi:SWIM zinc finger
VYIVLTILHKLCSILNVVRKNTEQEKMLEITKENIQKATAKARETKPLVKILEFRKYQVTNRETGAKYTVKFSKIGNRKFAECDCKCGQQRRYICKHIGASIGIHIVLAAQTVSA